jgi:hypothetical protein
MTRRNVGVASVKHQRHRHEHEQGAPDPRPELRDFRMHRAATAPALVMPDLIPRFHPVAALARDLQRADKLTP